MGARGDVWATFSNDDDDDDYGGGGAMLAGGGVRVGAGDVTNRIESLCRSSQVEDKAQDERQYGYQVQIPIRHNVIAQVEQEIEVTLQRETTIMISISLNVYSS